jgi:hypothetical protein
LIDTYYLTGNCNNCDSNYCNYCIYPTNNYLYYGYACTTSNCFLSSATIELEYGKHKTMDELSVDDRVLVSDKSYSDVYMFGHKDSTAVSTFLSSATIELEYGKHKTMAELSVGDRVLVSDNPYSDVYMFGHKDHTTALHLVNIATSANQTIPLFPPTTTSMPTASSSLLPPLSSVTH